MIFWRILECQISLENDTCTFPFIHFKGPEKSCSKEFYLTFFWSLLNRVQTYFETCNTGWLFSSALRLAILVIGFKDSKTEAKKKLVQIFSIILEGHAVFHILKIRILIELTTLGCYKDYVK